MYVPWLSHKPKAHGQDRPLRKTNIISQPVWPISEDVSLLTLQVKSTAFDVVTVMDGTVLGP